MNKEKPKLHPDSQAWINAIVAYKRDGNFNAIEVHMVISDKNKALIIEASKIKI